MHDFFRRALQQNLQQTHVTDPVNLRNYAVALPDDNFVWIPRLKLHSGAIGVPRRLSLRVADLEFEKLVPVEQQRVLDLDVVHSSLFCTLLHKLVSRLRLLLVLRRRQLLLLLLQTVGDMRRGRQSTPCPADRLSHHFVQPSPPRHRRWQAEALAFLLRKKPYDVLCQPWRNGHAHLSCFCSSSVLSRLSVLEQRVVANTDWLQLFFIYQHQVHIHDATG